MLTYDLEAEIDKRLAHRPAGQETRLLWQRLMRKIHDMPEVYTAGFIAGYWGHMGSPYFHGTPEHDAWVSGESDGQEWRYQVSSNEVNK